MSDLLNRMSDLLNRMSDLLNRRSGLVNRKRGTLYIEGERGIFKSSDNIKNVILAHLAPHSFLGGQGVLKPSKPPTVHATAVYRNVMLLQCYNIPVYPVVKVIAV